MLHVIHILQPMTVVQAKLEIRMRKNGGTMLTWVHSESGKDGADMCTTCSFSQSTRSGETEQDSSTRQQFVQGNSLSFRH